MRAAPRLAVVFRPPPRLLEDFLPRDADAPDFDFAPRLPPLAFDPPRAELLRALVAPDLLAVFLPAGFLLAVFLLALVRPPPDLAPALPLPERDPPAALVAERPPPSEPALDPGRDALDALPSAWPLARPLVTEAMSVAAPVFCAAPGVDGVPVNPVTSPVSKMLGSTGGAGFTLFGRPRLRGAVTAKRSASSSSSSVASGVTPGSSSSSS